MTRAERVTDFHRPAKYKDTYYIVKLIEARRFYPSCLTNPEVCIIPAQPIPPPTNDRKFPTSTGYKLNTFLALVVLPLTIPSISISHRIIL
jgi:hypothetical protein